MLRNFIIKDLYVLEYFFNRRSIDTKGLVNQLDYSLLFTFLLDFELIDIAWLLRIWIVLRLFNSIFVLWKDRSIWSSFTWSWFLELRGSRQGLYALNHLYLLQCFKGSYWQAFRLGVFALNSNLVTFFKDRIIIGCIFHLLLIRIHLGDSIWEHFFTFLHIPLWCLIVGYVRERRCFILAMSLSSHSDRIFVSGGGMFFKDCISQTLELWLEISLPI